MKSFCIGKFGSPVVGDSSALFLGNEGLSLKGIVASLELCNYCMERKRWYFYNAGKV